MTTTLRPGVYTDYTLSPVYARNKGQIVAVAAKTVQNTRTLCTLTSLSDAKRIFGEQTADNPLMQMLSALYSVASPIVLAFGIEDATEYVYQEAIDQLLESNAYLVVIDSTDLQTMQYMAQKIEATEKIAVFSAPRNRGEMTLCEVANQINSPRICMSAPMVCEKGIEGVDVSAILLAGLLSKQTDVTSNLMGEILPARFFVGEPLDKQTVESYLTHGINVFEPIMGQLQLIRGMTTATRNKDGLSDITYRNISVILIQDVVLGELRELLSKRIGISQNHQAGLNTILSLLICKLDDFVQMGLLHSFETPTLTLDAQDPTHCLATVSFTITQGISVIHLTAHISV